MPELKEIENEFNAIRDDLSELITHLYFKLLKKDPPKDVEFYESVQNLASSYNQALETFYKAFPQLRT